MPSDARSALQAKDHEEDGSSAAVPMDQYLLFEVRGGLYGVDILQTQEVLKPVPATRIPNTPREMLGVINLRGSIVPVIDLGCKFGHDYAEITAATRVIVCTFGGKLIGLLTDRVMETARVPQGAVEGTEVRGLSREYVIGAGRAGERVFLLMNPAAVFIPE